MSILKKIYKIILISFLLLSQISIYGNNDEEKTDNEDKIGFVYYDNLAMTYYYDYSKISNVGKLLYTIDILQGEEFIYIDKKEQFYFITARDVYQDFSYEKNSLVKEIQSMTEERENLDKNDNPYIRDNDYLTRQYKDNNLKLIDLNRELTKLTDGYEHLWKSNIPMILSNEQRIETNNRMNILYEEIKRKKEDIIDYETQQYDIKKREAQNLLIIKEKKEEFYQKEKEARLKLHELEKDIEKDHERKYMIKMMDSHEQIVKRIPIIMPVSAVPMWECMNITTDNDRYYYGIYKDRIYLYDEEGNPVSSFGKYGTHPGEIIKASQIAVDNKKSIYVVDTGKNCISKYSIKQ
ncbi:hypothetical protein HY745_05660 [Candidatus Desantisbacteria bacterium]|nr:hypothetical protein [Candidatus Desantisbacteria bacterium]